MERMSKWKASACTDMNSAYSLSVFRFEIFEFIHSHKHKNKHMNSHKLLSVNSNNNKTENEKKIITECICR